MYNDIERILLTKEQLNARIKELGEKITQDYKGKNPLFICVLKGSVPFFTNLILSIDLKIECDFISVSSYGNKTSSSGNVKMIKDLDHSIEGKDLIIVEDIVDSGHTLTYLKNLLLSRNPASLKICTLLDKECRREVPFTPDYVGFKIDDYFVVGFGLDYDEKYRNLPEIGILKSSVYSDN